MENFGFTLDPASSSTNHKCAKFYTEQDNGLVQDWTDERVFINPPYTKGQIQKWVQKAILESSVKNAACVVLVPVRSCGKWWKLCVEHAKEIRFITGRLKFSGHKNSAPFPSAVIIFDPTHDPTKTSITISCVRNKI